MQGILTCPIFGHRIIGYSETPDNIYLAVILCTLNNLRTSCASSIGYKKDRLSGTQYIPFIIIIMSVFVGLALDVVPLGTGKLLTNGYNNRTKDSPQNLVSCCA